MTSPAAGSTGPIDTVLPVEINAACAALTQLGRRLEELVRSIPDSSRMTRGLDWTLGETAAHVLQTTRAYTSALRGVNDGPDRVDDVIALITKRNEEELLAERERGPAALARALGIALADVAGAARKAGTQGVASFSADYSATTVATVCGLIVELAVHGHDIARTLGGPWSVAPAVAVLGVYAAAGALPFVVDEEASRGRELHIEVSPRGGTPFGVHVDDGRAWTSVPPGPVDARLSIDPFTFLLLAYGRIQPWTALLRGRLVVSGRRPWRAVSMDAFFRTP